ncbi:DUF6196 family protein [Nocardia sp. NPDC127526]|uniref:DUF6196 family protein n=1 Tax=Nocardia sp. NPDC127526 TaxID=3345393 RepID=UPI00362CEA78
MVDISHETPEQTDRRLREVIAAADFVVHEGEWWFRETPITEPPQPSEQALAVVRDDESWSALVPVGGEDLAAGVERFGVFSFHFPPGVDNSGFVGWLATHLKQALGTGVFVICGSNAKRGGIYDYWGCPSSLLARVEAEIRSLR